MTTPARLPDGRLDFGADLAAALVAEQFPQWAGLPVVPVEPGGRDNRTFRLGDGLTVRMPSGPGYAGQPGKEFAFLPRLAPLLPLAIPEPLALGRPGLGYPFHWTVCRWIEGQPTSAARIADPVAFARAVAAFLSALRRIDTAGAPPAGPRNFHRGGDLAVYDAQTRAVLDDLDGRIDTTRAIEIWALALASKWQVAPVWVHGDIAAGNLIVRDGRLAAIIDFGSSGIGDPACDLTLAWTLLTGDARDAFRSALDFDPATWARAKGWALWKALITLAPLAEDDPAAREQHRVVSALFGD